MNTRAPAPPTWWRIDYVRENRVDFHDLHVQRQALQPFGQDVAAAGEAATAALWPWAV